MEGLGNNSIERREELSHAEKMEAAERRAEEMFVKAMGEKISVENIMEHGVERR